MSYFNTEKELISLDRKSIYEKTKLKQKMLASSALLIAGILIVSDVVADTSNSNLTDAEESITSQQQQELIDWSLKAQAKLTKRLDAKMQQVLTSMLLPSGGHMDNQVLAINLPTLQPVYAGKPATLASGH